MDNITFQFSKYASNQEKYYLSLCNLYEFTHAIYNSTIYIDFSQTKWISANLMAPLGLIFEKLIMNGNKIILRSVSPTLKAIFFRYGFRNSNDIDSTITLGVNYYKTLSGESKPLFKEYIWSYIERFPIAEDYKSQLNRMLVEIFINIKMHARNYPEENIFGNTEVFCTGHYHPRTKFMTFTIANQGLTFRDVISKKGNIILSDSEIIPKALENGFSTKGKRVIGGMGLYRLNEFIKATQGRLIILSGNSYYECEFNPSKHKPVKSHALDCFFPGSCITIMFCVDNLEGIDIGEIYPNTQFTLNDVLI